MAFENFDKDEQGNIRSCPLAGWELATLGGMALLARLSFFRSRTAMANNQQDAVQLVLTPEQCRELAAVLLRTADQLTQPPQKPAS